MNKLYWNQYHFRLVLSSPKVKMLKRIRLPYCMHPRRLVKYLVPVLVLANQLVNHCVWNLPVQRCLQRNQSNLHPDRLHLKAWYNLNTNFIFCSACSNKRIFVSYFQVPNVAKPADADFGGVGFDAFADFSDFDNKVRGKTIMLHVCY